MRETKFRGKRKEYSEWIYGYLIGDDVIVGNIVEFNDEYFNTAFWYKVRPETVGQYTGLKDKNRKEIYEGDILRITCNFEQRKGVVEDLVEYYECSFACSDWMFHELISNAAKGTQEFEVIGNIYENKELLP